MYVTVDWYCTGIILLSILPVLFILQLFLGSWVSCNTPLIFDLYSLFLSFSSSLVSLIILIAILAISINNCQKFGKIDKYKWVTELKYYSFLLSLIKSLSLPFLMTTNLPKSTFLKKDWFPGRGAKVPNAELINWYLIFVLPSISREILILWPIYIWQFYQISRDIPETESKGFR